jgi:hypothetical protein
MSNGTLTLRPATDTDAGAIARLAAIEEADALAGDVLLAELDGHVIAALALADDRSVADSSRPTAAIVALLRERREQLIRARRYSYAFVPERPRGERRLRGLWRAVPA